MHLMSLIASCSQLCHINFNSVYIRLTFTEVTAAFVAALESIGNGFTPQQNINFAPVESSCCILSTFTCIPVKIATHRDCVVCVRILNSYSDEAG